jgi:hypothetical protein
MADEPMTGEELLNLRTQNHSEWEWESSGAVTMNGLWRGTHRNPYQNPKDAACMLLRDLPALREPGTILVLRTPDGQCEFSFKIENGLPLHTGQYVEPRS